MKRLYPILFALSVCAFSQTLSPEEVKVMGALNYGQTSTAVDYSGTPQYCAFVFNGNGDDKVEVTVKGDRAAVVIIADGALKQLASDTTHLTFALPNRGPDAETYYILFRDTENKPGRFTVQLKGSKAAPAGR